MAMENTAIVIPEIAPVIQEIANGDGVPLSEVAGLNPTTRSKSGHSHTTTPLRWVRNGVKRPDGTVVRLEAARVGTRWLTSRPAIIRFITALNQSEQPTPTPTLSTQVNKKRAASAAKLLEQAGA